MSDANPNKHMGRDADSGGSPWFHRGIGFPIMEAAGDRSPEPADSHDNSNDHPGRYFDGIFHTFKHGYSQGFAFRDRPQSPGEYAELHISAQDDPCGIGYVIGYIDGAGSHSVSLGVDYGHRPAFGPTESPFPVLDVEFTSPADPTATPSTVEPPDKSLSEGESMSPERHPAGRNCAKPAAMMMFILACLAGVGLLVAGQLGV